MPHRYLVRSKSFPFPGRGLILLRFRGNIKHKYENITKTQIHSHLQGNKCLEIFVLEGDADKIRAIFRNFKISGKMDYVKLITA